MNAPRILLIVGGGIAAYKACELVRLIKKGGGEVVCVLTHGGSQFVTPMTLAALSENAVHTSLWNLKDEVEIGHIQLSRQADLVVVCPASADLLAKMAAGVADDLATTLLLATDKPVLAVPAMNVKMWEHPATRRNIAELRDLGVLVLDPAAGPMACGEFGPGRLPEPEAIWQAIGDILELGLETPGLPGLRDEAESEDSGLGGLSAELITRAPRLEGEPPAPSIEPADDEPPSEPEPLPPVDPSTSPILVRKGKAKAAPPTDPDAIPNAERHALALEPPSDTPAASIADPLAGQPDFAPDDTPNTGPVVGPLTGTHILITAGPTHEPIDPVRYIANRSSGKQGFAIAAAAAAAGARVTLVAGPVSLATPAGVERIDVETAREMAAAVTATLPVDVAIMVAAVADWRTRDFAAEKMKKRGSAPPALVLAENPDILASLATGRKRPRLVIGFAAETQDVVANAKDKLKRKAADWIIANDVSGPSGQGVMGGADNRVHLVTKQGVEDWPPMPKDEVARQLIERIADALG